MSTKISLNRSTCESTIPKALTRATGLLERLEAGEEIAIRARPVCGSTAPVGSDIALDVSWGADVTGERIVELRPGFDRNSGQTKLRISKPLAVGWGLDGCQIAWEDHEMEPGETTTLTAPIQGWASPLEQVRLGEIAGGQAFTSTLTASGGDKQVASAMLPREAVRALGIDQGAGDLALSWFCLGGDIGFALEPVDVGEDATRPSNVRAVTWAGPNDSQARISAGVLSEALGLEDVLFDHGESVTIGWTLAGDRLLGAVGKAGHEQLEMWSGR